MQKDSFRIDLDEHSRDVQGFLYCLACHNKLDLPICSSCHRLIDDRVIHALGKQWHVEVNRFDMKKKPLIFDFF